MVLKKEKNFRPPKKLRRLFAGYIGAFCIATILLVLLLLLLSTVLLSQGVILPANYRERQLSAAMDTIKTSDTVTPDMIPETCGYGVYTMQGSFLYGNYDEKEARFTWRLTQVQGRKQYSDFFYLSIPRQNEICIVRYTLVMQYSSPILQRFLPAPELLLFILFGIGFLGEVFLLASSFGKDITNKLRSLQHATEKIQKQDLNFSIESSGIYEIDHVLHSIDKMKEALKSSLQDQWELEDARRDQVSALAHDIKTPITVVRGNAELLLETSLTEEQREYAAYISASACQMEQYVKKLIEFSRTEHGNSLNKKAIDTNTFMEEILKQVSALSAVKKLSLQFKSDHLPQNFCADSDLLMRAILNIISNAVDFSKENGTIVFKAEGKSDTLRFCVVDSGPGFSAEAFKHAKQQFYMGDKSRTSKSHYGMGLYIANTIAVQHGGSLVLENSAETGGAKVTLEIPMK